MQSLVIGKLFLFLYWKLAKRNTIFTVFDQKKQKKILISNFYHFFETIVKKIIFLPSKTQFGGRSHDICMLKAWPYQKWQTISWPTGCRSPPPPPGLLGFKKYPSLKSTYVLFLYYFVALCNNVNNLLPPFPGSL